MKCMTWIFGGRVGIEFGIEEGKKGVRKGTDHADPSVVPPLSTCEGARCSVQGRVRMLEDDTLHIEGRRFARTNIADSSCFIVMIF